MRKSLLFIAMFAFIASSFAQMTGKNNLNPVNLKTISTQSNVKSTAAVLWSNDFSTPADWTMSQGTASTDAWVIGTNGPSGSYAIAAISSTTAANGFALFDSDAMCGGDQDGYLTTANSIDFSAASAVVLNFESYYRKYTDKIFVGVSTDGTTWTDFEINASFAANDASATNPTLQSVNISSVAANQATVWIRFEFRSTTADGADGCDYSWMVDDIEITDQAIANDMEVVSTFLMNSTSGFYGVIPANQAAPVSFTQNVINNGTADQTNVSLEAKVNDGTSDVFTGTSTGVTVVAGADDSLVVSTNFNIPAGSNDYTVAYNVSQTETDEVPENNVDTVKFATDDNMFARAYSITSYVGTSNLASLGGGDGLVVGNVFSFVNNASVEAISLMIYTGTTAGVTFKGQLYDASDMSILGETADYTVTASDITNMTVTIVFTTPVNIPAGTVIIAGMEMTYGTDEVQFLTDNSDIQDVSYNIYYLPGANSGAGAWTNLSGAGTPAITLGLGNTTSVERTVVNSEINIYPNPTTGLLNVTNAENATINIYNTVGALVKTVTNTNTVDLSDVQNGTYIVKVITNNNVVVKNIVLAK